MIESRVYVIDDVICCVQTSGHISTVDDAKVLFSPALPLLEEHGITKVIFDHRETTIEVSVAETFATAANPEAWGWKKGHRAAVVFSAITENQRFLERVALNRGVEIKIFTDFEKARRWLLQD